MAGRFPTDFKDRLKKKLVEQIRGRNSGFLLGAGASFLNGNGYPLAAGLWPAIRDRMQDSDKRAIDDQIPRSCSTLEEALDAIDLGGKEELPLRHRITGAIAKAFVDHKPPLEFHRTFVSRLSSRQEKRVPVFTLNYDVLMEHAADLEKCMLFDGFCGNVESYFHPTCFNDIRGRYESRRGKIISMPYRGIINLYKLHGSLGWYVDPSANLKRIRPEMSCPSGWRNLMIPPQNRKASDTGATPYASLWSDFRAHLANDSPRLLNRLVCVGYGFCDGHVNAVINTGIARTHFTLIVLAKTLSDNAFNNLRVRQNVIVVTESRSSLYGEEGIGSPDSCMFEWLSKEM